MKEITYRTPDFYKELESFAFRHVHLILIATKPDIIKQIPLYHELKARSHNVILGHTGQHYDENLSGGMLKEFGVEPDFNLNVRGESYEVISQIIARLGFVIGEMKKLGKVVIPYVHGDTTTAMAASNAGFCHAFPSVHVEAGIRTLTPDYEAFGFDASRLDADALPDWRTFLMDRKNWKRGSLEPYPEQFNTRAAEAATGVHLAPVELDREFLTGEGFPEDRIFVVGNTVADATREAMDRAATSTIFETYPLLKDGNFVRFCIHRRENCLSEKRFRAIIDAMISLVEDGKKVLLISLFQTEAAIDRFGLRDDIEALAKKENFVYSPVWPLYTDVIAAMGKAAVCATDSGSMQEEMNVMGVPCVTLRFGSDRSESVIAGGNIIAPPVDAAFLKQAILFAWENKEMRAAPKLYGEKVSAACIDAVEQVLSLGEVARSEEERLGM